MPGDTCDALDIEHAAAGDALPLIHGLRLDAEPASQDRFKTDGLDGLTETFSAHAPIQSTTLNVPSSADKRHFVDQVKPMSENSTMASRQGTPLSSSEINFATNLRRLRARSGMTLDEVAKSIGVTNQAVHQYEKGRSRIGARRIPSILQLFGVTFDDMTRDLLKESEIGEILRRPRALNKLDQEVLRSHNIVPHLFPRPSEDPTGTLGNELETNIAEQFDGLRIEGEVAAGRWIEVHGYIDGDLAHHDIYDNVPVALDHRWPKAAQYGLIVCGTSINNVAVDGDVLTCVGLHETSYRLREYDLVIVEQRRDAGLLIERTAKRWMEHDDRFELWPDSSDPRWQTPIIVPKQVGLDVENNDGISISVKAFVTWIHRPVQVPVRRKR